MGTSNHWEDCYLNEGHPLCRLLKIHDLQKEVQALKTQLQYERTGHLLPQVNIPSVWCSDVSTQEVTLTATPLPKEPVYVDHIEPPIQAQGPTWAHRNDEPPSFTP